MNDSTREEVFFRVARMERGLIEEELFDSVLRSPPPPPIPPPSVNGRISLQPRINPIFVQLEGNATLGGQLTYSAIINYTDHGRNDTSPRVRGSSNSLSFTVDFGNIVQGGRLRIDIAVPYASEDLDPIVYQLAVEGTITGDNPAKAMIRSLLSDVALQVICYKESRFRHFDGNGWPIFGVPNGFGAMQLDTPAPTASQIWNWRENVAAGQSLYVQKQREVNQHFQNIYSAHPEAPRLNAEQTRLALYQYYNGGFYWHYNVGSHAWERAGVTAYGDDAMRIERLVNAGTPPGDWS